MVATAHSLLIGIYGPEEPIHSQGRRSLWPSGYAAAIAEAGGTPVPLGESLSRRSQRELSEKVHAIIWTGRSGDVAQVTPDDARFCEWCRKNRTPLLAVDNGLQLLNMALGGSLHLDLARERPEALQHRHPPEKGLRHAIDIRPGTKLANIYGEGELVVNSEHRRAICHVAREFRVCAMALDGIIEAIETEHTDWFALGVQWRPAAATASGLDIQLFRGLLEICQSRLRRVPRRSRAACTSAA
jgi:putative glutamine amidotransferase